MLPVAHTGHTLVDVAVFLGPVAIALGWLWLSGHRAKRRRLKEGQDSKA